jgi:hypothetical protein
MGIVEISNKLRCAGEMAPQSAANVKYAMFITRGSLAGAFHAAIDAP